MKINKFKLGVFLTISVLIFITEINAFSKDPETALFKPFRVLVIIGDQWEDPASYMVTKSEPTGEYSGYYNRPEVTGPVDFFHLMVLLKSWAIPFDVIRLDQQFLDRYIFLDIYGKPKYGTIIWDVNKSDELLHPDYSIIREMVQDYGIGIIALSNRIFPPEIQSVLGLKYIDCWESNKEMEVVSDHFLTKGLNSPFKVDVDISPNNGSGVHMKRQQVEVLDGTVTLVKQGSYPQATTKVLTSGAHAVWIGNDHNNMFYFQDIRTLLRRAITWTIGYNLYKTWENDLIMIMDDPGGAQSVYLEHWHYPELTEDVIEKYLIKPLQEHNAILNINFVAGFVNDKKHMLEPTWKQNFIDEFGTKQDYISGKRGFDKGVKLGVFEVMCHGLTHMQPDLVSEPGWYGTRLDQEKAEVGWYREFGDTRRHKEIPAAEQLWRMKTAKEWIIDQFEVTPLQFCAGGGGISVSYYNNTFKLAGLAGFGWFGWENGYLGTDMVIIGWDFSGTPESPLFVAAPPDAHDFGITTKPEEFATIFNKYPQSRFMGINEFIGYLHANNSGYWGNKETQLTFILDYDPHYCLHFNNHQSSWTFELSDWLEKKMGAISIIKVDGKAVPSSPFPFKIPVPTGTGKHKVEIVF
ncbi:MAG: hypothetical protein KAX05_07545 [Bacteroidales bacterium]|nr:hypothetical protein [Bacteroidales bacterium]